MTIGEKIFLSVLFLLLVMVGFVLGWGTFYQKNRAETAYVQNGRVCILTHAAVDPCLTRKLPLEEAAAIAGRINAAIGREWRGLE